MWFSLSGMDFHITRWNFAVICILLILMILDTYVRCPHDTAGSDIEPPTAESHIREGKLNLEENLATPEVLA